MFLLGGIQFWFVIMAFFAAMFIGAIVFKAVTGKDLEPPDDGSE